MISLAVMRDLIFIILFFVDCLFQSDQFYCISSNKTGIGLERVAFKNISNAFSTLNIASDENEVISILDCSDSLSSYSKSSFYFFKIGKLIFKQLNFSLNKCTGPNCQSPSISYDEMFILQDIKFLNIIRCKSELYIIFMDSEPSGKDKEKTVSGVNIMDSFAEIIIYAVSTYNLEDFCLSNNKAKYSINYYRQYNNCFLKLNNFWITDEFRKTGDSFDLSGVNIGQSIIPFVVFMPHLNKNRESNRRIQTKHNCLHESMLISYMI